MNKISGFFIILAVFGLIWPSLGQADIAYISNGDKLFGKVLSPSFTVQTPYGQVIIRNEFLKSITFKNESIGRWLVETINNDVFSGTLLNDSIEFIQENGERLQLTNASIRRIRREIYSPSYPVMTTIITMKNNDRFSGRLIDTILEIQADYVTPTVQSDDINRIEFGDGYPSDIKILLENGDLITGILKKDYIRVTPDAVAEFALAKSSIRSIQFNAPKMVLKKFSGNPQSEKDRDGDGVPDYADICMDTPRGVAVNHDGCASKSMLARVGTEKETRLASAGNVQHQTEMNSEFQNILFDFDQYELKPQYYSVLDEVAIMLSQNPATRIEIQGHTDNVGTAGYNQNLSKKRARAVKNYFVRKGVEEDRLFPEGFGFTKNVASNENDAGRALNRRVELAFQN
jgi:outer membrane protein OmpA-like peptidoglycan-associated protein